MTRSFLFCTAILAVISTACRAVSAGPLPFFDRSQIVTHAETLSTNIDDASVGFVVQELQVYNDSVRSTIIVSFQDSVHQEIVLTFDPRSLEPRRVRAANSLEVVDLFYSLNLIEGTRTVRSPVGKRDTLRVEVSLESSTLDRRHLLTIVPWLPLVVDRAFVVPVFDSWSGRIRSVRIEIEKELRIKVPAGSFRAYRVRLTSPPIPFINDQGLFPTILFVSVDSPRRILRVERPEQDAISVLTNKRP